MWDVVYAQAEEAPAGEGAAQQAPSLFGNPLFMIVAFFAIMYFLMIRPSQKREKQRQEMLGSLSKNDQVVTTGGVCGTIVGLKEKTVVLRVSDDGNMKMEFLRGAISQVISRANEDESS